MTWLGRKLNPDPELGPGEEVIWKRPVATWIDGRDIAGTLYLTGSALIFNANLLNPVKRRRQENYPLSTIARVEFVDRTWRPNEGGFRRRMRIVLTDGSSIPFGVGKGLEETIAYLNEAIGGATRVTRSRR